MPHIKNKLQNEPVPDGSLDYNGLIGVFWKARAGDICKGCCCGVNSNSLCIVILRKQDYFL